MYKTQFFLLVSFKMDESVEKVQVSALGKENVHELYVGFFFRMFFNSNSFFTSKENLQWLTCLIEKQLQQEISKQLILVFSPFVEVNGNSGFSIPWWELTESSFVEIGLEYLGRTFHHLYTHHSDFNLSKKGKQTNEKILYFQWLSL